MRCQVLLVALRQVAETGAPHVNFALLQLCEVAFAVAPGIVDLAKHKYVVAVFAVQINDDVACCVDHEVVATFSAEQT